MPLTDTQLAWVRSEVGDGPADDDLNARYERLGTVRDVAIEVLRERRANMLDNPLTTTLSGVASVSFAENVKALERRLQALVQLDDDPSDDEVPGGEDTSEPPINTYRLTRSRRR